MKKILHKIGCLFLAMLGLLIQSRLFSQTVAITANQGQSTNIVVGPSAYHVSENIYTEDEIGAANFTSAATAINHIDFNVFVVGSITAVSNYNLYLKEVPLTTTSFSSATDVYSTAGYTLVFSGTFNANTTGWVGVDLTTTFTRTPGNNLELLIERLDNVAHGAFSFNAARGNNTNAALNSSRRNNLNTLPVSGTTVLNTLSPFRAQIQLRHISPNDAAVKEVYTLGKLPIPFATPHIIAANIVNNGSNVQTNLHVNLDISGANTFSDMQTIASLAPGASTTVHFLPFTPVVTGHNSLSVSIPADNFNGDNSFALSQEVTNNAYNYAYGTVPTGSVGFNNSTGDIVAMFTSSSPSSINQVGINFGIGGQPFRIGIWDKSGNALPGSLLWESTDQVSTAGLFNLQIYPPVAITDTFYIGVKQTGNTNIQFSYQNESPVRPSTFFSTTPTGTTAWADFGPSKTFKFMIEPRLTIANDVGVTVIKNPLTDAAVDNCGIVPQAMVVNFGSNNQTTPFNVTFKIKQAGNTVYSSTKQVSLNTGESKAVYFDPFAGSLPGADSSFVYTILPADGNSNNDTVINKFTSSNYSYSDSTASSGGYSFANSTNCASPAPAKPVYNWITETTNEINWNTNGNDSVLATPVTLPFTFNYFGNAYNQFWVSSNGWISFSDPTALAASVQKTPVSIPLAGGIQNYIAGVLTNLDVTTATYADAHTYYGGNAGQFVVTFKHAHLAGSATDFISFQIILNVNGNIIIQYNDAESSSPVATSITNSCSAGIENIDGTKGILYRLNGNYGPLFESPVAVEFFTGLSVTPVTLLDFTVQHANAGNKITWSTSQEINSKTFIIERSTDGRNFFDIGSIAANGNSNQVMNYSFEDNKAGKGINFYRLRTIDINNSFKYSAVLSIRNDAAEDITVFPNPVKNNMSIRFNADGPDKGNIIITDFSGKVIYNNSLMIIEGYNQIKINTAAFASGAYLLKLKLSDHVITKKINKL